MTEERREMISLLLFTTTSGQQGLSQETGDNIGKARAGASGPVPASFCPSVGSRLGRGWT